MSEYPPGGEPPVLRAELSRLQREIDTLRSEAAQFRRSIEERLATYATLIAEARGALDQINLELDRAAHRAGKSSQSPARREPSRSGKGARPAPPSKARRSKDRKPRTSRKPAAPSRPAAKLSKPQPSRAVQNRKA